MRWIAMDGKLHSVRSLSRYVHLCTDLTKMTTWLNMSASRRSELTVLLRLGQLDVVLDEAVEGELGLVVVNLHRVVL